MVCPLAYGADKDLPRNESELSGTGQSGLTTSIQIALPVGVSGKALGAEGEARIASGIETRC